MKSQAGHKEKGAHTVQCTSVEGKCSVGEKCTNIEVIVHLEKKVSTEE